MEDTELSCRAFVQALASSAPAPGGGGASALTGAVGTALAHMVGALTVGKKQYAAVQEDITALMERCETLQEQLLKQIQADAQGFLPLSRAYSLPQDDPCRDEKVDAAAAVACKAPLRVMELCCQGLEAAGEMARKGSRLALSDAGCAAVFIKAALQAAALNVLINTRIMKDRPAAQQINERCLAMLSHHQALADGVFEEVMAALMPHREDASPSQRPPEQTGG